MMSLLSVDIHRIFIRLNWAAIPTKGWHLSKSAEGCTFPYRRLGRIRVLWVWEWALSCDLLRFPDDAKCTICWNYRLRPEKDLPVWHCVFICVSFRDQIEIWHLKKGRHRFFSCRPYWAESARSHPNSEAKQLKARLVLGWGTAWESRGVDSYYKIGAIVFRPHVMYEHSKWLHILMIPCGRILHLCRVG